MKKVLALGSIKFVYDRGFSFLPFHKARRLTPETLTTLNRTPGISPTLCPDRPKPETRTSSSKEKYLVEQQTTKPAPDSKKLATPSRKMLKSGQTVTNKRTTTLVTLRQSAF